jgi:peptidoglycan/LPS O-acetylase OafA/YrhL
MRRYSHLDGLRGAAALLVVLFHGMIALYPATLSGRPSDNIGPWDAQIAHFPFFFPIPGGFAVCLFFALSGFVLASSYSQSSQNIIALALKRYVRLTVPIFAICLISCVVLIAGGISRVPLIAHIPSTGFAHHFRQVPSFLSAAIEALTSTFQHPDNRDSYCPALWTMPIEFAGSVLLIIAFSGLKRMRQATRDRYQNWILAGLCILLSASYLGLFFAGAWLYTSQAYKRISPRVGVCLFVLGALLGSIGIAYNTFLDPLSAANAIFNLMPVFGYDVFTCMRAIGAVMVMVSAFSVPQLMSALNSRALQFLGQISFSAYLVHGLVIVSVISVADRWILGIGLPYHAMASISMLVLIAITMVSASIFNRIEAPAISLAHWVAASVDDLCQKQKTSVGAIALRLSPSSFTTPTPPAPGPAGVHRSA